MATMIPASTFAHRRDPGEGWRFDVSLYQVQTRNGFVDSWRAWIPSAMVALLSARLLPAKHRSQQLSLEEYRRKENEFATATELQ